MAVIYKPGKQLLHSQIKKFAHYIKGDILDVGAGKYDRYSDFFNKTKYVKTDNKPDFGADIVADAQNLPVGDMSFDSVISTQTLEHLPDPGKAVKEFYRVLKKGGYCLATAPFFNEIHEEPYDYWRFTNFALEKIFKEAGFKVMEMEKTGGFFTTIASLIIRYKINKFNLNKSKFGKLINPLFKIFAKFMMFLDKIDKSKANNKFAIDYVIVAKKE